MVSPTITIPVNFKSSTDSTGHYKKITININEDNLTELQLKIEAVENDLHNIDGRTWTGSLPYTVV